MAFAPSSLIVANYILPINRALYALQVESMDILARVNFLEVNDENWNTKYISGFRSNINYGTTDFCCLVAFEEDREIKQGETINCELSFLTHEPHIGKLAKGMEFTLFSGNVVFAKGIVRYVSE